MKFCLLFSNFLLLSSFAAQQPLVSAQTIQEQLDDAEKEFREAKKMFNPWYAGPLLAPSAHVLPPGNVNFQPYVFLTNNYQKFSESGRRQNIDHIKVVNPQVVFQFGMFKRIDSSVSVQTISSWRDGKSATHFGDTTASIGIGIQEEQAYKPAVLINIKETFPTGKYRDLSSSLGGVDATGAGAYSTTASLNISKVVWWIMTHPINFRASFSYTFPSIAKVKGFHAYGGGYGTKGKIHTPNSFSTDLAFEYSFTQKWVLACDAVYSYSAKAKFVGKAGVDAFGNKASNGASFNDNLSLAPAIEYNPSSSLGLLAGVWFSIWGRNSLNYVSGVVSVTYTF